MDELGDIWCPKGLKYSDAKMIQKKNVENWHLKMTAEIR